MNVLSAFRAARQYVRIRIPDFQKAAYNPDIEDTKLVHRIEYARSYAAQKVGGVHSKAFYDELNRSLCDLIVEGVRDGKAHDVIEGLKRLSYHYGRYRRGGIDDDLVDYLEDADVDKDFIKDVKEIIGKQLDNHLYQRRADIIVATLSSTWKNSDDFWSEIGEPGPQGGLRPVIDKIRHAFELDRS